MEKNEERAKIINDFLVYFRNDAERFCNTFGIGRSEIMAAVELCEKTAEEYLASAQTLTNKL